MGKDAPELWEKFLAWYTAVFAEGALTEREKALIALAVSHAVQCPYCIDAYTTGSLEKGATPEQMTEAVHVASAIRGGASLVHAVQMRNKIDKIGCRSRRESGVGSRESGVGSRESGVGSRESGVEYDKPRWRCRR
jgi:alkylhydroperoxidase/carboxymuconolactone decarboxylase family protein